MLQCIAVTNVTLLWTASLQSPKFGPHWAHGNEYISLIHHKKHEWTCQVGLNVLEEGYVWKHYVPSKEMKDKNHCQDQGFIEIPT